MWSFRQHADGRPTEAPLSLLDASVGASGLSAFWLWAILRVSGA